MATKCLSCLLSTLPEKGWKQQGDAPLPVREPPCLRRLRGDAASFNLYPPSTLSGLVNTPRHWVRPTAGNADCLSDARRGGRGAAVADLAPGRELRQLTHNVSDIQSAFNWHPSGKWLGFVLENRIASVMPGAVK
jgi:hypothetical protein